jgi:hypothetical protein
MDLAKLHPFECAGQIPPPVATGSRAGMSSASNSFVLLTVASRVLQKLIESKTMKKYSETLGEMGFAACLAAAAVVALFLMVGHAVWSRKEQ